MQKRQSVLPLFLALGFALSLFGLARADGWPCDEPPPPNKEGSASDGLSDSREGGESWSDAIVIPGIPYLDSGATCDNRDDIFPNCAQAGGRDVVYRYTPATDMAVAIDLCNSGFDTVIGVYDASHNQIACADDQCGSQSVIYSISLRAAETYFIVVDGYGPSCGSYELAVHWAPTPCNLECPAGALLEGEPPCSDGYPGGYNGGCCGGGGGFQTVLPQQGHVAVMCGKGGTYSYEGFSYRDTDWFEVWGNNGILTATCRAEFPLLLIFIWNVDCSNLLFDQTMAEACQTATLSRYVPAGTPAVIWVGSSAFSGWPCELNYVLELDNIGQRPTSSAPDLGTHWGAIKSLFR